MLKQTVTPTKDNKIFIELTLNNADYQPISTNSNKEPFKQLTVNTTTLMKLLNCGKQTAIEIGTKANSKIYIGRRVLWNVKLIQEYLDTIAI